MLVEIENKENLNFLRSFLLALVVAQTVIAPS
jgi:hypothetical protein